MSYDLVITGDKRPQQKTAQETIVVCHVRFSFLLVWQFAVTSNSCALPFFYFCMPYCPARLFQKHILGNVILDAILWHRAIFYLEMIYAPSCVLSG